MSKRTTDQADQTEQDGIQGEPGPIEQTGPEPEQEREPGILGKIASIASAEVSRRYQAEREALEQKIRSLTDAEERERKQAGLIETEQKVRDLERLTETVRAAETEALVWAVQGQIRLLRLHQALSEHQAHRAALEPMLEEFIRPPDRPAIWARVSVPSYAQDFARKAPWPANVLRMISGLLHSPRLTEIGEAFKQGRQTGYRFAHGPSIEERALLEELEALLVSARQGGTDGS